MLRSLFQDSIREYYLRCSYGVARDEEYDPKRHKERCSKAIHGNYKTYDDYHGAFRIVQDRIHWFFNKAAGTIKAGRVEKIQGWIGAPLRGKINIEQTLYPSKYKTKDGLAGRDPKKHIEKVATMGLFVAEVEGWGYLAPNPETGEEYQIIAYEMLMNFDNPRNKFEMIIPDGGKFRDEDNWGEEDRRYELEIQLTAGTFATPPGSRKKGQQRVKARPTKADFEPRRSGGLGERLNFLGTEDY